ncbi:MAG: DUF4249 domain-containing protein [Sphingobacteriales bacterium]|jgi:hypothetical protein|nr:DUF4249 domain-containing protein [Sphingobacteriales bacterium]
MKSIFHKLLLLLPLAAILISCEKEIDLNIQPPADAVVVEGHIENGLPPYVLLTRNSAFFGNININDISSYFISGASITVLTDDDSVQLVEYNTALLQLLPDSLAIALAAQFGLSIQSAADFPPITIYTVALSDTDFTGKVGKQYDLRIRLNDKIITAATTIPKPVYFDSLWLQPHPNPLYVDSFFQVYGRLKDPIEPGNYYRYFSKADNEPFLISDQSVFDDAFINGKKFNIFIPKGYPVGSKRSTNFNTSGYWTISDSVCTVKLCMIDKPHYDFWRTLESNRIRQGNPFGAVVFVKSNVNGALGVWGGYGSITGSFRRI